MQKTVYILGAGFSKPLGLPIMSDFIDMARDLYATNPEKYKHFSNVFNIIRTELAWIGTAYEINLNNIEEVLSVLEMMRYFDKTKEKEFFEYTQFIKDVINSYTRPFRIHPEVEFVIRTGLYSLKPTQWMGWIGKPDWDSKRYLVENFFVNSDQKSCVQCFL